MERPSKAIKLGELLIRSGILTSQQLLEAIELAKETSMPIGKMLVMCGTVSEEVLLTSVQLQSMHRDNQIDIDGAVSLLTMVFQTGITLDEAMVRTGRKINPKQPTIKLGEILFEAGFIGHDELDRFLQDSKEAGLPLGRIILLYGSISREMLSAALTAQVLVRDGKVSREQAIKALKTTRRRRINLEESLKELGFYRQPIRPHTLIGELFIKAGLMEEADVLSALEMALDSEIPVGQAMIQKGLVKRPDLEIALELQEMVINATLSEDQAAQVLNKVSARGFSPTSALTELAVSTATQEDSKSVWQLLTASGIISREARDAVFNKDNLTLAELGHNLLAADLVDEFTMHNASRCQFLMRTGFLDLEKAIVVLNHCRSRRLAADEALKELNWIAKTRMELDSGV
ncbi:MAG: hypothetical protein IPM23_04735 [Candidatus Melainabacteria bacterium]|nr:hypothetical protein [Candidatus Melainabacteria bacterium]